MITQPSTFNIGNDEVLDLICSKLSIVMTILALIVIVTLPILENIH